MRPSFSSYVGAAAIALIAVVPLPVRAQDSDRTRLFSDAQTAIGGPAALSPDGKWVVFQVMDSPSVSHLAVARVGGGPLQAITPADSWAQNPDWSPSGDRIYFLSNRPAAAGDQYYYGMEVRFDPATGRAVGEPRQVTTDPAVAFVRVSPDGKNVVFVDARDRRLLRTAPVAGGESRVIARIPMRSGNPVWSRDGRFVYFVTNEVPQTRRVLHRVPAAGGEVEVVSTELPAQGQLLIGPGAEIFVRQEDEDGPRNRRFLVYDQRGRLLRTIAASRNTRPTQVTADARALVAVEADVVAPTRIMPVEGGAYRDITQPVAYDWVMRWSDDGNTVYTWTEQDGKSVLAAIPVQGGAPSRTFPESAQWGAQGANSRFVFQASRRDGVSPRTVVAIDLRNGSRHTVTETAAHTGSFPYGPGGTWAAHEELYYLERRGDWLDVKGWLGPGAVRTLHSLPATLLGRTNFAVHGNRVAWQQERGDSADLMIADGENAEHRRLLTMHAMPGVNEISFSHDGKLLALHYSRGPGSPDLMAVVDPSGVAPPRIIDTGLSYWYWPRWLPDDSGVLVVGGGSGAEAYIARVPVAEGQQVVNITRSDPASKWGFEVSPDGRFIAYPGEIWRGSSVWRMEMGDGGRQVPPE